MLKHQLLGNVVPHVQCMLKLYNSVVEVGKYAFLLYFLDTCDRHCWNRKKNI